MKDELSRTTLFVRVAEFGTFSAVARATARTPSSINRQISALEEHLGIRLFRRTTRRLHLTEAGEVYLRFATRISADLQEAERAVKRLRDEPAGLLRVTAPTGLALQHISPILPEFFRLWPQVQVALDLDDKPVDMVAERRDVAIHFGHMADTDLRARRLAISRSALCCSPGYLRHAPAIQVPGDLRQHNCLSFRTRPGPSVWRFRRDGLTQEVAVRGSLMINSGVGLASAALADLGVVILPGWHVAQHLASGALVPLLTDYTQVPDHTPVSALFAPDRHLAPKVRVFIDFVAEHFAKQDWSC